MTKRPYADPTAKRRSVYLSQAVWDKLKKMGNGSASAGIREAVKAAKKREEQC